MNSEKVKEIKKVLEEGQFNKIKHHQKEDKPILVSFADILTLINELESENNELKKHKCDWLNGEKMHLQAEMEETEFELLCANKLLKELTEENQQLKDRIAELGNLVATIYVAIGNARKETKEAEEYAKRELCTLFTAFAEKVKREFYYEFDELIPSIMAVKIDKILKEFIGETNE